MQTKLATHIAVVTAAFVLCASAVSAEQIISAESLVTTPLDTSAVTQVVLPESSGAPTPQAQPQKATQPVRPSMTLMRDKPVSQQLALYAAQHGWTLLWEASEYTTPVSLAIFGSPDIVATYFLEGARNAGISLTGVIHPQIKIIQISE